MNYKTISLLNVFFSVKGAIYYVARATGGGALVSCSTSTPINHIVFFGRIPGVLENHRSSQEGGGCAPPAPSPLDPPPLSQFETINDFHLLNFFVWTPQPFMNFSHLILTIWQCVFMITFSCSSDIS